MNCNFSVIIPLYNKEAEIERTVRSVLAQTLQPTEIVIVDDGSTDRSAEIVESIQSPLIKLIRQTNAGECAARNCAMAEATGDYYALVDADDAWKPDFLKTVAAMIDEFPDCGIYSTGFDVINTDGRTPGRTIQKRGVVEDFFRESMTHFVCIPSASVIPAKVVCDVGGFPEGMRLGGDQYMWTKIARKYKVCFTPERMVDYYMAASNRSAAIYRPEQTVFSFREFYDESNYWLCEYIARVEIGKAITISAKGGTKEAFSTEEFYKYNRTSRRLWWRLHIMNEMPACVRPYVHAAYSYLAWHLAGRGM